MLLFSLGVAFFVLLAMSP